MDKNSAKRIPIALQLYSVRNECKKDWPGTLAAVAKMGYEAVEFAGYYQTPARELRKMLDDLGLKAAGTHIGLEALLGDELARTIEFNRTIGNDFLIVPGLPKEQTESAQSWAEAGFVSRRRRRSPRRRPPKACGSVAITMRPNSWILPAGRPGTFCMARPRRSLCRWTWAMPSRPGSSRWHS